MKRLVAATVVLAALGAGAFVLTFPNPAGCLALEASAFQKLSSGVYSDAQSEREQQYLDKLVADAKMRIAKQFGPVEAEPKIVFFRETPKRWPSQLNPSGSTHIVGTRACVMIGPQGRSTDIVAHELLHAEVAHRVGAWTYAVKLPTWFDEGVAMQVDHRPQFRLSDADLNASGYVRELTGASTFFSEDPAVSQKNYASARAEVSKWLAQPGVALYPALQRIQQGQPIESVLPASSPQ